MAYFYWKFSSTWCLLKKCIAMNVLQWLDNFCLKFHYFTLILLLHFSTYLGCRHNEYPVKETASLYLKLPVKPAFFSVFLLFWIDKSLLVLNLFISEYLDKIPPWKEMKEVFSVKIQTENCCFGKLNKAQAAQIKNKLKSLSTFMKISRYIPEVKTIWIDQWLAKYICKLERIREKRGVGKKVRFVPNTVGWSGRQHNPWKILQFLPSFKLTQNCFVNMKISFPWKLAI